MDSFIEDLRIEYATQDNRMTAYPIYVQVQELNCQPIRSNRNKS